MAVCHVFVLDLLMAEGIIMGLTLKWAGLGTIFCRDPAGYGHIFCAKKIGHVRLKYENLGYFFARIENGLKSTHDLSQISGNFGPRLWPKTGHFAKAQTRPAHDHL